MLMGSETEFGILGGWRLETASAIQQSVERNHLHLPSTTRGVFLRNGARVYVDQGAQNEYCTPEVDDPLVLVRHELAGRTLMKDAAAGNGAVLLCSNVDYATLNAWGTHENYELGAMLDDASLATLLTHLATRIIYTGAGGPHPRTRGARLVMSPRAALTRATCSEQGTLRRSMVFHKPANYGAGHRLHVTSGESLICPRASWLKYGTTALLARCLDTGSFRPDGTALQDPLQAMHRLNSDVGLQGQLLMTDGTRLTGLQVQRRLVERLEARRELFPPWGESVLQAWVAVLDGFASRDERLHGMLDWLLYRRLWRTLVAEQGYGPQELQQLEHVAAHGCGSERSEALKRLETLCASARELYIRLHTLDDASLGNAAAAAGWMEQSLSGLEESGIRWCRNEAPPGRAGNRARLIRMFHGREGHQASWESIVDTKAQLACSIPHDREWPGQVRWEPLALSAHLPDPPRDLLADLTRQVAVHVTPQGFDASFRQGDYAETVRLFEAESPEARESRFLDWTTVALGYARMGRATEARNVLARTRHDPLDPIPISAARLFCCVNYGLIPPPEECSSLIAEGSRLRESGGDARSEPAYHRAVMDQCRGWVWLHQGRSSEAIGLLRETVEALLRDWRPRMLARSCCFLAEGLRRTGDREAALEHLHLAARIHHAKDLPGDAADHLFPVLAKLGDRSVLSAAELLHRRRGNGLGLARILCLFGRIEKRVDRHRASFVCFATAWRCCERVPSPSASSPTGASGSRASVAKGRTSSGGCDGRGPGRFGLWNRIPASRGRR